MATRILNIRQLTERHPAFSEPSVRWLIFNSHENGLADSGALLRNGRRVLIDETKFLAWLEGRQASTTNNECSGTKLSSTARAAAAQK